MTPILFNPVIPWPWLAGLLLLFLAALGYSFRRGLRSRQRIGWLWGLRLTALAALVILLLQPQRRHDEVVVLRPQLAVLIDNSESMTDRVDPRQPRRADRVHEWLKSRSLDGLRRDFDLRLFTLDPGLTEQPNTLTQVEFKGERSNLLASLAQLQERFRGQPLAGILLLSDGLDPAAPERVAPPPSVAPVYALELERPFTPRKRARSVTIVNVDYPQRATVGRETEIRASLAATGMQGQTITVELWRDGRKQSETVAAFNEDSQKRDVSFVVSHERPGLVQYELRVPACEAEAPASGRRPGAEDPKKPQVRPFLIEVIEPGNRILYLQNALGFDFKFLKKALVSDRNLQLSAYVRWADNRIVSLSEGGTQAGAKSLDLSQPLLTNCSVILLGDLPPASLPSSNWRAIQDFVDRGGGLVLLGGPNALASTEINPTLLGKLLPVRIGADAEYREGNFPVEITPGGLRHPVFGPLFAKVSEFPPLLTANLTDGAVATAEVLMQTRAGGRAYPLVASMRFGQGRVVVVLTDTIWRWRLAAKGWTAERSPYETFWAQLMDWLIPKEQARASGNRLDLFTERFNYLLGDRPEVRAILRDPSSDAKPPATLPLQVRTPDNKTFDYTLRPTVQSEGGERQVFTYRVEVEPFVDGVYRATSTVSIGGANVTGETRFVVARPASEQAGKPINRELLTRIAEANHGKIYPVGEWDQWRQDLHYPEQHFERVQLQDLWNHPLLLGFLIVTLCAEWFLRKRWNLP